VTSVLDFCSVLRRAGVGVTPRAAIDASRSLDFIDVADERSFRAALQANLAASPEEQDAFLVEYDRYWHSGPAGEAAKRDAYQPLAQQRRPDEAVFLPVPMLIEGVQPGGEARLPGGDQSASDVDLVTRTDFAALGDADALRAMRAIRRLAPRLATVPSRRSEPANAGTVDLRRTLRALRRPGGEVAGFAWKRPRVRRLRLVALCDVSGSMDAYSPFLLQFLYALQRQHGLVRTFVFSTRLEDISAELNSRRFDGALRAVAGRVTRWSGGTSIGESIADFNERYAAELVSARTVVLIASDGWERGDSAQLSMEMALLRRRARRIVWLNPLKGRPGYQPLAKGMAAALPHVDDFVAANSVESLEGLARLLASG
jgi:hypothetical protein